MRRLEELTPANYNKILTENEFQEFERILGVMSLTSRETGSLFRQLSDTCVKALKTMGLSTAKKKNIQRIQGHLKEARQAELSYAKRLPFSFGSGWQPGNLSTARVLVNAAGYLLVAPALFSEKGRAAYNKGLSEMRRAMETYRKEQQREYQKNPYSSGGAEATYTSEGRKEVQQAVKDLKVFLQTSRLVVRTWNRQIREINKVLRNTKYSERVDNIKIDGDEVFGKTEDAWRRAA